jgi:[glutamine synthetase] adenylyltransferase / [glutamine synthetase]-adenylyl-L-tyrosine phosphorylase
MPLPDNIEKFIDTLPDPAGARLFIERLFEEHPRAAAKYTQNQELSANILALAAYSPLLAETMLQHPEYIAWLERERALTLIKSKEELVQELARFAAVNSTLEEPVRLARFKRRELLRIYLRDCIKIATLFETTEELSNLADAVLERALQYCYQPLLARYGQPQTTDRRGRIISSDLAVIGLGKLGSRELNYSSDIDLIFIYSADGETAGTNTRGAERVTNRFFFTKLAEAVVKMIGSYIGEGVVFRIDLRLRPRGREGDLVVPLWEAIRYYRDEAQNWERQALVKARAAAGDQRIVDQFLLDVRDQVYHPRPLVEALRQVRLSKEKIDTHAAKRPGGYNVKLGQGGIREIEFIVQALQICYGGQDAWLRAPQTSIGLQRLADKNLITDSERTRLAQAYNFLRMVEHRLQMEHGLQTHSLPLSDEKIELLARRCGYGDRAAFERDLELHRQNVSAIYQRVFEYADKISEEEMPPMAPPPPPPEESLPAKASGIDRPALERLFQDAVGSLLALPAFKIPQTEVARSVAAGLQSTINVPRSLRRLRDFALSLATVEERTPDGMLGADQIRELTTIGGASQYFIQILISNPNLAKLLGGPLLPDLSSLNTSEMRKICKETIADADFDEAATRLRRCWHEQLIKIGRHDLLEPAPREGLEAMARLRQINFAQTALAETTLGIVSEMACARLADRYERTSAPMFYTILGLGRLGHYAIDYNSDLDIIFVYSDEHGNVVGQVTNQEFYARVMEMIIQTLSALTRQGSLYRVDSRLRPDGRSGLLAISFEKLQQYLSERAAVWELMAYLKLRSLVGDPDFGARVEQRSLDLIFERAGSKNDRLVEEVREIRARLVAEKERSRMGDFKFGTGGMLDVHFASRYLQLRHGVSDSPERNTLSLIDKLAAMALLEPDQATMLKQGHSFLRLLDHQVRLQLERPQTTLPLNPAQRLDLARGLGFDSEAAFQDKYRKHLEEIHSVYLKVVDGK